jgi:hypothetical protein
MTSAASGISPCVPWISGAAKVGPLLAGGLLLLLLPGLDASAGARRPVHVTVRDEQPKLELVDLPTDPTPRIAYNLGHNMRVGFMVQTEQGFQRITCGQDGSTNNTVCRIDNGDMEFGAPQGRWDPQRAPLEAGPAGKRRQGTRSTWVFNNIRITQIVEIVPTRPTDKKAGPAAGKRLRDACVLRYVIDNKDTRAHRVGIRNMIDTLIVNNDGALFAVPGKDQILAGADFRSTKEIPAWVQVLERPDLKNPGVVAHITPKLGGRIEPPNRLTLTGWPGSGVGWEVPARQAVGDSAYAIYWDPKEIPPNGKREVGFAYGRGIATGVEDEGRVVVSLGGSFEPQRLFTVTAYVESPVEGQSLTLELPAGMAAVEGKPTQPVPQPLAGGLSVVLWKGRVLHGGEFPLKVRSSTGYILTKTVTVTVPDTPGKAESPGQPGQEESRVPAFERPSRIVLPGAWSFPARSLT